VAALIVRKLDDETYARLRVRATQEGVSMEEEVRRILKRAVAPPQRLGDVFLRHFGSKHGVTLDLPSREKHEPPDLKR